MSEDERYSNYRQWCERMNLRAAPRKLWAKSVRRIPEINYVLGHHRGITGGYSILGYDARHLV